MDLVKRAGLNRILLELGSAPDGGPRFRWLYLPDLPLLKQDGYEIVALPTGLLINVPKYRRADLGEQYGKVWCLCVWEPTSLTQGEWEAKYQNRYPYPKNGQFYPISNTVLSPGEEPEAPQTRYNVRCIAAQLAKMEHTTPEQTIKEGRESHEKKSQENEKLLYEVAHDALPFTRAPGEKRNVSLQAGIGHSPIEKV